MERFARRPLGVTLRIVAVLGLAGCSNQQRTSANPFLAPDRVPPPATRTIAPGTAQPYYPGDPVPAAQVAAPAAAMVAQAPQVPQAPTVSVATLPASAPSVNAPTASAPAAPTSTPQPLAFSNERTVSIPKDSQDLRFSVPPPPASQSATATPIAAPAVAATPPPQQVIPASYTQPTAAQAIATQPAAAAPLPMASAAENSSGPWRAPQIPGASSGVMQAQYVQPPATQPTVLAAQPTPVQPAPTAPQMPVQLRAVPSPTTGPTTGPTMDPSQTMAMPQVQPQPSPPPRMRFPSWSDPTSWFTPQPTTAANQQLVGYMVPGPNGTQQMISVEQYQAMVAGGTQPAATVAASDGFRARGTSTK